MSVNELFRTDSSSGMLMCHLNILGTSHVPQHHIDGMKHQKLNQKAYGDYKLVPTGSLQECLASISDTSENNWLGRTSDEDYMLVVPCCEIGSDVENNLHMSIDTTNTKPGYLRLPHYHMKVRVSRKSKDSTKVTRTERGKEQTEIKHVSSCKFAKEYGKFVSDASVGAQGLYLSFAVSKQAWLNIYGDRYSRPLLNSVESRIQGPAVTVTYTYSDSNVFHVDMHDLALALKCAHWPSIANEWRTRARPHGWPSAELIDSVTREGCHMVSTAHSSSEKPDIEWRFSFTVAEKTLALSLTRSQRNSYIIFKTIVSHWIKPYTIVSSYCLKNILFWTLEKIPQSVWENNTVKKGITLSTPFDHVVWENDILAKGMCFSALLDELIHCLAEGNLPHYFIRTNNLIEYKARDQIRDVLRLLVKLRKQCFIPFFVTVSSGLVYVVKVMEFHNLINDRVTLNTMSFAETSPLEIQELLCESRLFDCMAEHIVFPRYFTEVVGDIRHLIPEYFEQFKSDQTLLLSKVGKEEFTQHAFGFGWCMFVYDFMECPEAPYFGIDFIEKLFESALNHTDDQSLKVLADLYFSMFLYGRSLFPEALAKLEAILLLFENDANVLKENSVVRLCEYEARVVSEPLRRAMIGPLSEWVHVKTVVYHLVLHAYSKQDRLDKVESLFSQYKQHTELLENTQNIFADAVFRSGLNILGHDLQHFGFYEDAIRIYQLHQEQTCSNPGIQESMLEEIEKCLLECRTQLETAS